MTKFLAQEPAEGIMKTGEFGDSKFYKINCQCGNHDDSIAFEVEADETGVTVNIWTEPKSTWRNILVDDNFPNIKNPWVYAIDDSIRYFINSVYHRVKLMYQILTVGYVKYHHTTIMSEQQALNFSEVLKSATYDCQQFREERAAK